MKIRGQGTEGNATAVFLFVVQIWSSGVLEKRCLDTAMEGRASLRPMIISWNPKISSGCSSLTVDLGLRLLTLANPLFYRYNL